MLKKKIFMILLLISLFCLVPSFVSAVDTQNTTLDLTQTNTEINTEENLNTKGWKWDKTNQILTLKDAKFETTNYDKCIILPEGNVTIEFEGNNTLTAEKATVIYGNHNSNLTLKGINGGTLNLEITKIDNTGGKR